MKKTYLLLICFLFYAFSLSSVLAQDTTSLKKINVKQITSVKWNTPDGLVYKQVPGANLGITSFAFIDTNKIAFLSDASSEIIITGIADGKTLSSFPVPFAPMDFVYDSGLFYVLYDSNILVYNVKGEFANQFSYPSKYIGVMRLTRFSGATYLLLPSGNSLKIEHENVSVVPEEHEGWITANGDYIYTKLNGDETYTVKVTSQNNAVTEGILKADKKVAGVYVVGSSATKLVLDVQTWISESPVAVERNIVVIERTASSLHSITSITKVPDCYFVLSNKEIDFTPSGEIVNMVTSPQGAFIFSLNETDDKNVFAYPSSLTSAKYHFNDHLLPLNEN